LDSTQIAVETSGENRRTSSDPGHPTTSKRRELHSRKLTVSQKARRAIFLRECLVFGF
jgi:hypothetical protein